MIIRISRDIWVVLTSDKTLSIDQLVYCSGIKLRNDSTQDISENFAVVFITESYNNFPKFEIYYGMLDAHEFDRRNLINSILNTMSKLNRYDYVILGLPSISNNEGYRFTEENIVIPGNVLRCFTNLINGIDTRLITIRLKRFTFPKK